MSKTHSACSWSPPGSSDDAKGTVSTWMNLRFEQNVCSVLRRRHAGFDICVSRVSEPKFSFGSIYTDDALYIYTTFRLYSHAGYTMRLRHKRTRQSVWLFLSLISFLVVISVLPDVVFCRDTKRWCNQLKYIFYCGQSQKYHFSTKNECSEYVWIVKNGSNI